MLDGDFLELVVWLTNVVLNIVLIEVGHDEFPVFETRQQRSEVLRARSHQVSGTPCGNSRGCARRRDFMSAQRVSLQCQVSAKYVQETSPGPWRTECLCRGQDSSQAWRAPWWLSG